MNIAVLGAGAWGTALAIAFAAAHRVRLWSWDAAQGEEMSRLRANPRYLPGAALPSELEVTSDLSRAVADADLLLVATPLAGLRPSLLSLKDLGAVSAARPIPLLWACKGLEAGSGKLPHQIVAEELGTAYPCGALSGPSFADEVARQQPTAITLASLDAELAAELARQLHTPRLRIYAHDDVVGVEVGGAVKNVLAIATGIADGLNLGLNARAALVTRGLAEIARLGEALGGRRETFMGLAGMGDLILTCTGDLSRNRRVGLGLGQGKTLSQILGELGHVAEGVSTAREVAQLARQRDIDMPITLAVDAVLHHDLPAAEAVEQLLARDPKAERD
ncbi:glycerol-3-phosphate dehydrogenase [NAD(P)+] [Azospira sp. I13]|uniref:NAD(P)H-dependent glycerol-3-phosphate dehydrogenase n=1 Tax=Azospira sp. I13 TaxID=1765050 RepID=UPI000D418CF7|nr:NAD(P)H-dependent glycerol-3-phosphate dehydrogenase [Azospira sp. I13]GBG02393.1 glycerol-3-phosphate dehydrogenase [NAD(P)+] [Azospira sp. I13]